MTWNNFIQRIKKLYLRKHKYVQNYRFKIQNILIDGLLPMKNCTLINSLSANPTKWSNTLKQFVGKILTNCLSLIILWGWRLRVKISRNKYLKTTENPVSNMSTILFLAFQ